MNSLSVVNEKFIELVDERLVNKFVDFLAQPKKMISINMVKKLMKSNPKAFLSY